MKMYTQSDWLRELSTVVEHLSDVSPAEVLGNLKRACSLGRSASEVLDDLGTEVYDEDTTRAVVELAGRLAAWRPVVLATQRLGVPANSNHFDPALAAAALQSQAAISIAEALLHVLQRGAISVLGPDGSTNVFRVLHACYCVVLGSAAGVMQRLQQELTRGMAAWPDELLHSAGGILSQQCSLLVSTARRLLTYNEGAAARGTKPAMAAVTTWCKAANLHGFWGKCVDAVSVCEQLCGVGAGYEALVHLCQVTKWLLEGVLCTTVPAFQRQLRETSALLLGDGPALESFLSMAAACHRLQVQALVTYRGSSAQPQPKDSKLQSVLPAWMPISQLLRRHALAEALASGGILEDIAAAAVAAVPTLLHSYLFMGALAGREELLEGINAVACHCCRLAIAPQPGLSYRQAERLASKGLQVARVVWEGLALTCAALQAVLEKDIAQASSWQHPTSQQRSSRSAVEPAAAEGNSTMYTSLVAAIVTVQALLARVSLITEGSNATAVAPQDVGAAAAGLEAALRLCALLWQRAEQLRALVGREAVAQLADAVAMTMNKARQAVVMAMEGSRSPGVSSVQALHRLLISLAKVTLFAPLSAGSMGFEPMHLAGVLNQLKFCLPAIARLDSNPQKPGLNERFVFLMWSLLVSYTHVFPAAVLRASSESGRAVLVSCAGHLVRLALDMRCTKAWGRSLESRGLEELVADAARDVMVAFWYNAEARDELEDLLQSCRRLQYLERGPVTYMVEGGLLEDLFTWAAAATGVKRGWAAKALYLQRQVVELALGAAGVLVSEWKERHPDGHGTLIVDGKAWDEPALQQFLSALRGDNQQLRSKGFWEKKMQAVLLPVMRTLAAHTEVPEPDVSRQDEAEALMSRPCANPLCVNMRGCSEARLPVRRCGGCRAVRYCSQECQRADYKRHQRECGQPTQALASRG